MQLLESDQVIDFLLLSRVGHSFSSQANTALVSESMLKKSCFFYFRKRPNWPLSARHDRKESLEGLSGRSSAQVVVGGLVTTGAASDSASWCTVGRVGLLGAARPRLQTRRAAAAAAGAAWRPGHPPPPTPPQHHLDLHTGLMPD